MADGKIYIIVTDQLPGGQGPLPPDTPDSGKEKTKENKFESWATHQFLNLVKQQVIQNITFTVNNIGNFTGDYQAQRDAQLSLSLLQEGMNLGLSIYAGYKIGNIPGAAIAAGVYAVNKTISTVQEYRLIDLQQKQSNYSIQQLKNRSGLNSNRDGSRGTEN